MDTGVVTQKVMNRKGKAYSLLAVGDCVGIYIRINKHSFVRSLSVQGTERKGDSRRTQVHMDNIGVMNTLSILGY